MYAWVFTPEIDDSVLGKRKSTLVDVTTSTKSQKVCMIENFVGGIEREGGQSF